jgi:hypothetical protein
VKRKKRLPVVADVFPPMRCDDGCGECCGPVPVTQEELERVAKYVEKHNLPVLDQGLTCPFFQKGRCAVHEVRPFACQAFGHVEGMSCIRGYNVNIPEDVMHRRIIKNGEPATILHELLQRKNPMLSFQGVLERMVPAKPLP